MTMSVSWWGAYAVPIIPPVLAMLSLCTSRAVRPSAAERSHKDSDVAKGVIVAGGLGSRLYPLTHATNKHLLPIYDRPMVFYPIDTLVRAGIRDIMIVIGGPHAGHFISVLRNGRTFGVQHLEFAYQEQEG